ncbi:MAG: leucine-rich repeat domain-containing protein [Chloroflexi bacterium]|nr:leucine-rich repeat domain-containing protein [Chloroflexota bacterium]
MSFTSKTTLVSFLAVAVLSLLLLASPEPRTVIAQQPDYTTQCSNGIAVPNPQSNPGLVADCAALLAVRDAFAADPPLNWSPDTSIHDWEGITSESTLVGSYFRNRVVRLRLHNDGLTGSVPPELSNLANLDELDLSRNQLTGSIPPELGNLANLDELDLSRNQLTGSIPPELGNLANLRKLYLNENQLTGSIPPELGNLANLWILYLNENQLTGSIPPELGNLANLWILMLSGNQLTGCIPVALRDVGDHDFGSLGLPLCDAADTTPNPTPPPHPTATPPPIATPTPTATPIPPTVPDDVLNRLGVIESLLATLQGLISALESRIAALETDASSPTPTPVPVVPTPTPMQGEPTHTPVVPTPTPNDRCIDEVTNSASNDGSWDADCESVTSRHMLIDSGRGNGPHYALYYTFTLTAPANVTVTLDSDDQDTFLYLLEGKGTNVAEIGALDMRHYNDDHGNHQDTDACANDGTLEEYDSCITKSLAAGDYTLEATTYNSRATGSFTLTVSGIR